MQLLPFGAARMAPGQRSIPGLFRRSERPDSGTRAPQPIARVGSILAEKDRLLNARNRLMTSLGEAIISQKKRKKA